MNFKRKKSKYKYRCAMCNSSRTATKQGDFNQKDMRNNQRIKESKKELEDNNEG